jgi:hypothetical protein
MKFSPTVLQFTKHAIMIALENDLASVLDYVRWTRSIVRPLLVPAAKAILGKKEPTYGF